MAASWPLDEPASVVLDAAGAGSVSVGPVRARQIWQVNNIAVHANRNPTNESECRIFVNGAYYAGTFSGSSGDNTDADVTLRRGNQITAQWIGGDAGQRAEIVLSGIISLE